MHVNNFSTAKGSPWLMQGNDIESYAAGLWHNQSYSAATPLTIDNNDFKESAPPLAGVVANNIGILFTLGPGGIVPIVTNNTIDDHDYGIVAWGTPGSLTINGTNSVSDANVGVYVTNNVGFNPIGTTSLGLVGTPTDVTLSGLTITNSGTGIQVRGDAGGGLTTLNLQNGVQITGGTTGLAVSGSQAAIGGGTLADTAFSGQSNYYVSLTGGAGQPGNQRHRGQLRRHYWRQPNAVGRFRNRTASPRLDDPSVGLIRFRPNELFVTTPGTGLSDETIQNAVDAATAGNTIYVDSGTFNEGVNVNKTVTLRGAKFGVDARTRL